MKTVSSWFADRAVQGGTIRCLVEAWLGPNLLATLPVVPGSWHVGFDSSQQIPGDFSCQVPALPEWRPKDPAHPLAAFGQQLRVSIGWQRPDGGIEYVKAGNFRTKPTQQAGSTLTVSGEGLLVNVDDAKLLSPWQSVDPWMPRSDAVIQLLRGILPVVIDPAVSSSVMSNVVEDEDRLKLILDICDGWPVRLWVDEQGTARILPAWDDDNPGDPVAEIRDGKGGTLLREGISLTPSVQGPNGYRVENVPEGDEAAASWTSTVTSGPMRWGGPYGYRGSIYKSATLPSDHGQLQQVSQQLCARSARRTDTMEVKTTPRPEIEVGDIVHIASQADGVDTTGRVTALTHTSTASTFTVSSLVRVS